MSILHDSCRDGETLRDAALDLLRTHRTELVRTCTVAALRIALDRGTVCADDVRGIVPIPDGISPKLVGAVFRDLADAGILFRDGYRPSTRPVAHARPISIWDLVDATEATRRLYALTATH